MTGVTSWSQLSGLSHTPLISPDERVTHCTGLAGPGRVTKRVTERVTGRVTERVTGRVTERVYELYIYRQTETVLRGLNDILRELII